MEVTAPAAGVVEALRVKVGDKVSAGALLLTLAEGGTVAPSAQDAPPAATATPGLAAPVAPLAAPAPAAVSTGTPEPVTVPDLGDFAEVDVIEVLVKPGDRVEVDTALITLESDKATMEVPSPAAGVIEALQVKVGDKVSAGATILTLRRSGAAAPAIAAPPVPVAAGAPPAAGLHPPPPPVSGERAGTSASSKAHASPSVRRFARELGVAIGLVEGSGPKGRITREDVQGWVKRALQGDTTARPGAFQLPEPPAIDFAKFGAIEARPLPKLRRTAGQNLQRAWITIPHVTQFDEADVTDLEDFRKQSRDAATEQGVKLTMLGFLMKAVVVALRKYPDFNASLAPGGENLILKKYYHIGFAADTPDGLLVPVVRDVDKKGLFDIAREVQDLSTRARERKLRPAEMQGGTFTISSLGGVGGTAFTPIVNAPEVAILGVSRTTTKPVWDGKAFAPRLILPLSLSYDHRVIDGVAGARFTTFLAAVLADIRKVLF